jgi:hypothetical protein
MPVALRLSNGILSSVPQVSIDRMASRPFYDHQQQRFCDKPSFFLCPDVGSSALFGWFCDHRVLCFVWSCIWAEMNYRSSEALLS